MVRLATVMTIAALSVAGCTAPALPELPGAVVKAAPNEVTAVAQAGADDAVESCQERDERRSDGGPTRVQVMDPFTIATFRHEDGATSCISVSVDGQLEWCSSRSIPPEVSAQELSNRGAALTFCESDSAVEAFAAVIPPAATQWVLVETGNGWGAYPFRSETEDLPMHVRIGPGADTFRVLFVTADGEIIGDATVTPYAAG